MSDFRFESAWILNFLWLLPLSYFGVQFINRWRQKILNKNLGERLRPFLTSSVSLQKKRWKLWLELFTLAFLILAMARPQSGEGRQTVKNEGIEVMFLVDVSNSMLAEDVRPSRLQLAKSELMRYIDESSGDRMGLVAFAGSAVLLSPMTQDHDAIKMYVESLSPESVSNQGTDIAKALDEAKNAFERGGMGDQDGMQVTRAVIIVSDGEDNEPGALEKAKALANDGIGIFTLAVGTEEGAPIPIYDDNGNLRGHRLDKSGRAVMTRTKGTILKDLANAGNGAFHHLSFHGDSVESVRKDIDHLKKSQFESGEVRSYKENFQYLLLLALIFGLTELQLGERRARGRIWKGRFEVASD